MIIRLLVLCFMVVCVLSFNSCSLGSKATPTYSDDTQPIVVGIGKEFTVSSSIDISSGLRWQPKFDNGLLEQIASGYIEPSASGTESEGIQWFRYKAIASGETELQMVLLKWLHERPFEQPGGKKFQVQIKEG